MDVPSNNKETFKKDFPLFVRKSYSSLIISRKDLYSFSADQEKSLLAKKMIDYFENNTSSNHIWEHLRYLLYFLAFGSPTEWPEMWEEYVFIKNYIERNRSMSEVQDTLDKIKEYIIILQKDYR